MRCTNRNRKLRVVFGDGTLGVHGWTEKEATFDYLFSYGGGPDSLQIAGKEWLYRAPKPTFWRALTDNDRGNKLHLRSGMWLAADQFVGFDGMEIYMDGHRIPLAMAPENNKYTGDESAGWIRCTYHYKTITVPSTVVDVAYTVEVDGNIKVEVKYHGKKGLPELPVFGMRFVMPTKAIGFRYEGLSGECYPDRMKGGIPGIYKVEGLPVTPYLVPQDCGVHMDTKWLEIYRNTTMSNVVQKGMSVFGIRFATPDKEQTFAFSCLPYTAEELENATHQEELPPARRTVVSILGAVRGVGGINSWGADVESAYRISAENDISYTFVITPI